MKKRVLITALISISLLFGCDSSECDMCDNCYSFKAVTAYSIDQITSLGCLLSPNTSTLYTSSNIPFILDTLNTSYKHIDYIKNTNDFSVGIYLGVDDVFLAPFFIVNNKIITIIDEGCYESICKISQNEVNNIIDSVTSN